MNRMERAIKDTEAMAGPEQFGGFETCEEPPAGKLEQAIAQIWMETFRLEHIGRNTDFYEIGGDSLIGMDLMEKISVHVNLDLPFVTLFQHSSPKKLAQYINALRYAGGNSLSDGPLCDGYLQLREQQSAEDDIEFLLAMPDSQAALLLRHLRRSRAQLRQDLFVLSELQFKRNGFFVELGATDGLSLSNTYLLEKGFGWQGILAEPCRAWHEKLLLANRRASVETRCVWRASGSIMSFKEVEEFAELSTLSSLSSMDFHERRRKRGRIYDVETISLNDLLERHNAPTQLDYLSIDTEGSEFDILAHLNFEKYRFSVITCEHNFTPAREDLYDLLTAHGYVRKYQEVSKVDDWYVSAVDTPAASALGTIGPASR